MNPSQLFIQRNLTALFRQFLIEKKVTGELLAEPDLLLYEAHHRHPDMAWLTNAQIDRLAVEGAIEVPAFVIEVISNKDASSKVVEKMEDYRRAGVQAVWHIFPNIEQVHVYAGEGLRRMVVCKDAELCSAAPALPGFAVPVHEIFKKGTGTGE